MVIAVAARVVERALDGVDLDVDADVGPVPLDQLQRVDRVRVQGRDHVDREEDPLAVRAQAEFLPVTLVVADPVEQGVGLLRVELGELRGQLLVVPGVPGPGARLVRPGLPEVDDVDDLLAVDAQRQRLTELLVAEHLAHLRVLVREVQVDLHLLRTRGDQLDQPVAALLHVLRQGRLVLQRVDVALLDVELARQRVEHQGLHVLRDAEAQAVDVGQLLTGLVDLPEVGVALHDHARGAARVGLGDDPGVERGLGHIAPARRDLDVTAACAEQGGPVGQVGRLGLLGGLGVVLRVELAAVVLREQRGVLPERRGQLLQEQGVRRGEGELDGVLVDLGDLAGLAPDHQLRGHRLVELGVLRAILDGEDDVVGREGLAVGPLHALAQVEDELRGRGIDFPALCHVGQHLGERQVPAHQALVADHAQDAVVVRAAAQAAPQRAPVDAHLLGVDHQRRRRQALRECRQLAFGCQLGQGGRLLAGLRPGRTGASHARQGRRAGESLEYITPGRSGGARRHTLAALHRSLLALHSDRPTYRNSGRPRTILWACQTPCLNDFV